MLRFAAIALAISALWIGFSQADESDLVLAQANTTKIKPADEGICKKGQIITVSKCDRGTMISCEDGLDSARFTCDADGYPAHVIPARHSFPITIPYMAKTPEKHMAPPAAPQYYSYHETHRVRRHGGRQGFLDFLGSVFQGKTRVHR